MVLNNESLTLTFFAIRRTKCHDLVIKTNETRTCKPNQKKRDHIDSCYSVPYGFKAYKNRKNDDYKVLYALRK